MHFIGKKKHSSDDFEINANGFLLVAYSSENPIFLNGFSEFQIKSFERKYIQNNENQECKSYKNKLASHP